MRRWAVLRGEADAVGPAIARTDRPDWYVTSFPRLHPIAIGWGDGLTCQEVVRQISAYLDADLDAQTRRWLEEHCAACQRCTAIVDGTRNVILLVGDDRLFVLPANFEERLRERLGLAISRSY